MVREEWESQQVDFIPRPSWLGHSTVPQAEVPMNWIWKTTQNCRMVGLGRNLWRPYIPASSFTVHAGSNAGCSELCPNSFWICSSRRLHNISGPSPPVLCHLHWKKHFLMFRGNLFQFVPVASRPGTGHHWKEFSLHPLIRLHSIRQSILWMLSLWCFQYNFYSGYLWSLFVAPCIRKSRRSQGETNEWLRKTVYVEMGDLNPVVCRGLSSQQKGALDDCPCYSIPSWANEAKSLLSLYLTAS